MDEADVTLSTTDLSPQIGLRLDLGELSRKEIKQLKRGKGSLVRYVQSAVEGSLAQLGLGPTVEVIPVALLYKCSRSETMKSCCATHSRTAEREGPCSQT
jgi:hypothetical protein